MFSTDADLPARQRWQQLALSDAAQRRLSSMLVQILGIDARRNFHSPLGSGFVIGTAPRGIIVVTAAHVLMDAANLILGTERVSALDHLETLGELFQRRVAPLIKAGSLMCAIEVNNERQICEIDEGYISHDYANSDVSIVVAKWPRGSHEPKVLPLPLDVEPINLQRLIYLAGFADGEIIPQDVVAGDCTAFLYGATVSARAGYLIGSGASRLVKTRQLATSIPAPAGFSGGPVIALRRPHSSLIDLPPELEVVPTAIGIVSHDASSFGAELNAEGCSYATPTLRLFGYEIPAGNGKTISLPEAIEQGWVCTFGPRSRKVLVERAVDRPGKVIRISKLI